MPKVSLVDTLPVFPRGHSKGIAKGTAKISQIVKARVQSDFRDAPFARFGKPSRRVLKALS